ncbi:MAG TPA: DUF3299 domain-containing protein [Candidatus Hydrogenedentes bacterium]|nr:DUF3299 domain-containing protein [Candidatus Hydrogenedentota bacterium]
MRRRAKRDLAMLGGIVAILLVALFANYMFGLGRNVEYYTRMRAQAEEQRAARGYKLLSWKLVRDTKWTRREGPTFKDELMARNETPVDIVGFMVPIDRYRDMTDFLLLPLPIECYFCNMPPREDVVLVQMAEGRTANRYKEPVLISGKLRLNEGSKAKFFYVVEDAMLTAGKEGGPLIEQRIDPRHFTPEHMQEKVAPDLVEGYEPPTP